MVHTLVCDKQLPSLKDPRPSKETRSVESRTVATEKGAEERYCKGQESDFSTVASIISQLNLQRWKRSPDLKKMKLGSPPPPGTVPTSPVQGCLPSLPICHLPLGIVCHWLWLRPDRGENSTLAPNEEKNYHLGIVNVNEKQKKRNRKLTCWRSGSHCLSNSDFTAIAKVASCALYFHKTENLSVFLEH